MPDTISESDWKKFRDIRKAALDRFCQGVLSDVRSLIAGPGSDLHERYLAVYDLIHKRDKELAAIFDTLRRSTALIQLITIRYRGLITDEEFVSFSQPTQDFVSSALSKIDDKNHT